MNNTRQIRPRIPRFVSILLIVAYALCGVNFMLAKQLDKVANDAIVVAEDATKIAKDNMDTAQYYRDQNRMLIDENYLLRAVLSSYHQNEFFTGSPTPPRYFNVAMPEELQSYVWLLCCNYGIDEHYELVYALIQHESKFDAAAISPSNDWGLMQINECNHEWLREELGIVDFLDPYENVHGGIHMLASLLHKYDVSDALMAYNMGEYGAAKLWRRGIHSTTYTDQVLDCYKQFTEDI